MLCRLESLVGEIEGALHAQSQGQTQRTTWEEGYSAPLYARVHMRLGMWQWTINSSQVLPCRAVQRSIPAGKK